MGATQGLLATMVASSAPENLRGTAFGFFNLAGGFVTLMSSVIAGLLWDNFGASAAFYASAGLCGLGADSRWARIIALASVVCRKRKQDPNSQGLLPSRL